MEELYTVTELARGLGTTPRAVRFYEDKGLITPRRAGQTRVYTRRDRGRLALILRGKRLGFSLREVGEWLDLYQHDPSQVDQMRALLDKTRERIVALEGQFADVKTTLKELREIESNVTEPLAAEAAETPAAAAGAASRKR